MISRSHQSDSPDDLASDGDHHGSLREPLVSLAFWLCLLAAVALYAMVVLSPKFVRWSRRTDEYAANQQQLLELRREIEFGNSLVEELESNRRFQTPLTSELPTEEHVVTVEEALRFHPLEPAAVDHHETSSLFVRTLQVIAGSRLLQFAVLAGGVVLLLFAFTSLIVSPGCKT